MPASHTVRIARTAHAIATTASKTATAAAFTAAALLSCAAVAQDNFPNKPLRLVVPFSAGSSPDVLARMVAKSLEPRVGQPVIVEARPGASSTLGATLVAKSPPDGYTIVLGYTGTFSIAPSLYADPGYDPRKDFAPIGLIGTAPSVMVVHPSVPVKTVAEFVAYAKAQAQPVSYGSPGVGTANHLAGELFASATGVKLQHIPYKGSGPAMTDLIGGHIPMMFVPIPNSIGNVQSGKLRALAVSSPKRSALLPELPTVQESLKKDFDVALRYGLAAPAGTPRPVIDRLNKALNEVLATADVQKRLTTEGAESLAGTPEAYGVDIDKEETMWRSLVSGLGLKVQ